MVYSFLTDRIGNMLFQVAAGASLAHRNNNDFIACVSDTTIPDGTKLIEYVKSFRGNILRNISLAERVPEGVVDYKQPGFEYSPIPFENNIILRGYFQSEKFFDQNYIKDIFSIDEESRSYIMKRYGNLFNHEIISIHVRRGDYIKRPLRQPICGMPYFRRAIKYFGKGRQFLVVSDDIEWCKKKFKGDNYHYTQNEPAIIDLYIQSLCNHNIISNSSFSWWGAWLNTNPNKIVIAPKNWFGVQMKNYNLKDLIPQNWIRVKNPRTISLLVKIYFYWSFDIIQRAFRKISRNFQYL